MEKQARAIALIIITVTSFPVSGWERNFRGSASSRAQRAHRRGSAVPRGRQGTSKVRADRTYNQIS